MLIGTTNPGISYQLRDAMDTLHMQVLMEFTRYKYIVYIFTLLNIFIMQNLDLIPCLD